MIGYALCGSFCTISDSIAQMKILKSCGYDILPIMSDNVYSTDTRFGSAESIKNQVKEICGRDIVHTVVDAEPLGPKIKLEALVVCPCTGNTLAKLANGITDTPVCMAVKAHMRADRPLVLALASNDALSANLKNIAVMLQRKCVYFVPLRQDDPEKKPHSLVADFAQLADTLGDALRGTQRLKLFC